MKTSSWIWFIAFLSMVLFVGCTKNPEKLSKRELFREAHKYMDEGDYDKALIYLDYLLENEPDEEEAYFDAAEVYLELDDEEAAYDVIYDGIEQFEDQKKTVVELIEHIIDLDRENPDNEDIKELESLLETVEVDESEAEVETVTNETVIEEEGRSEYLASVFEGKLDVLEYGIGDNLNDLRTGRSDYEADDYFMGGPYLAYEDLSVLGDPIMFIFYFGTESSNGIKRGMSVDEVKGILGEPDLVRYPIQENNEMDELFGGNEMLYFYNSGEYQMVLIFNVVNDGVASIGIQGKEQ